VKTSEYCWRSSKAWRKRRGDEYAAAGHREPSTRGRRTTVAAKEICGGDGGSGDDGAGSTVRNP